MTEPRNCKGDVTAPVIKWAGVGGKKGIKLGNVGVVGQILNMLDRRDILA